MFSYTVNCNLKHPDVINYSKFYEAIDLLGNHSNYLNCVWIIRSNYSILQIKRYLSKYLHKNDDLFISSLKSSSAFYNIKSYGKNGYKRWLGNYLGDYL